MVLRHILAVLCQVFSVKPIMTGRQVEEDPLHGLHSPHTWIPRISTCGGHLKILVYAAPVDNEEALKHCIVDACQTIRNYPQIFERMRGSVVRHVEESIEYHGGYFEHLL
jgi:hypothetical protein